MEWAPPGDWRRSRRRALRAEAEAASERGIAASYRLRHKASRQQLALIEGELEKTVAELKATRQELDAVRRSVRTDDGPTASSAAPQELSAELAPGKARAIDYAIDQLGLESFASLELAAAFGQYAFHAIEKPGVRRGVLIDVRAVRPRDHLLSAIEQAAERPGMQILDGSFSDPQIVGAVGQVDAVLLFDVLLRMVDPDWDQVLELYAPTTSAFVITNPQWEGDKTVRLIDLGREGYLRAVPAWDAHRELFDRLDEWYRGQDRHYRDANHVWQWGITDADLLAKMNELGFTLDHEWSLYPPADTEGFVNRTFVFTRAQP